MARSQRAGLRVWIRRSSDSWRYLYVKAEEVAKGILMERIMTAAAAVFTASFGLLAFNALYEWNLPGEVVQLLAGGTFLGFLTCVAIGLVTGKRL